MEHPTPPSSAVHDHRAFVAGSLVAGAAITALVGFLGIVGALGGGIPGTHAGSVARPPPLAACQGHDALGTFHFLFVAGLKGSYTFNGSSPGPCVAVAAGSRITVTFELATTATAPDSWVLLAASGPTDAPPVFPGAGPSDATRTVGLGPGQFANYTFSASTAGAYRYVSEVDGHAAAGMFGGFNVTTGPAALAVSGEGTSPGTSGASAGPGAAGARSAPRVDPPRLEVFR
jgi:FtsP/CotA-like multicopper oxidase with cupredoxin domain